MKHSYEITPRSANLGGGWRLRLLEGNEEVGGGVFPPAKAIKDAQYALQAAFEEAESEAYAWLNTKGETDTNSQDNERHHRQNAVDFALANLELSGFTSSEKAQDYIRCFIDGQINLDAFIKGVMDYVRKERDGC